MMIRLIAAVIVLATSSGADSQNPAEVSFCAVAGHPERYNGKIIKIRAGVLTDWHHGIVLIHSGCKQGIELSAMDAVPPEQASAFDKAVGTPLDGGYERTAMATFTGRFSLRKRTSQDAFNNPFAFAALRIENIQLYPRR